MANDNWKKKLKKLLEKWNKEAKLKIGKHPHICIRMFGDDTVLITDENGKPLTDVEPNMPLPGPVNTYDQAIWSNNQPCVWFKGRRH